MVDLPNFNMIVTFRSYSLHVGGTISTVPLLFP